MKVLLAVLFTLVLCASVLPQRTRIVTGAEANGTYRSGRNEIKILALGNNKLRIQMNLTYEYRTSSGPMANVGEAFGEATIENDTAYFTHRTLRTALLPSSFFAVTRSKSPKTAPLSAALG